MDPDPTEVWTRETEHVLEDGSIVYEDVLEEESTADGIVTQSAYKNNKIKTNRVTSQLAFVFLRNSF